MKQLYDVNRVIQARQTDMITFLGTQCGFTFLNKGNEYRCREHPSLVIKNDRLSWYWHSKGVGGYGALDYLMKVEGSAFHDAMDILQGAAMSFSPVAAPPAVQESKSLLLPEKAKTDNRLIAYLCEIRGIDKGIVTALLDEKKLYEDIRGNVVFVGYDPQGRARFACLRGTYGASFKRDCPGSDKRYGFQITGTGTGSLYVFEAPIDALSHAALENLYTGDPDAWRRDSRLSLGGTSGLALDRYLQDYPATKELVFCLDSDDAGRGAAIALARKYVARGLWTRLELPTRKDCNDVLLAYRAQEVK